jgi:hypothetical protein
MRVERELRERFPFEYAALADSLACLRHGLPGQRVKAAEAIRKRLELLANWTTESNLTIKAINQGELPANDYKPHVRHEPKFYVEVYKTQDRQIREKHAGRTKAAVKKRRPHVRLKVGSVLNHAFRRAAITGLVELLFGLVARRNPNRPIRWLDIACGDGQIANAVNPSKLGAKTWEIVGCDFQPAKIEVARQQNTIGRHFQVADAFQILDEYRLRGETFDIVSMFEFLEHLEDPFQCIQKLRGFHATFVVAASPLAQKFDKPFDVTPDPIHLWSFRRAAFEAMFGLAGFEVVYTSEARVGTYLGGLDWLTCICGPRELMRQDRTTW